MKKRYLVFYEECMQTGLLPADGLCATFRGDELFELINPDPHMNFYWGYDGIVDSHSFLSIDEISLVREFTPIRQTVVLLMAAMNNEL